MKLLADWIAQDRLVLHTARGDWLPIGPKQGETTQSGINFIWKEQVSNTPNPGFRRVEVSVYSADNPDYVLRRLAGFLVKQRRRQ